MTEPGRDELRRWALNFTGWEFQQETPPKYCPSGENLGRWRHHKEHPEWLCAHCQEDSLPQFLTDMNAVMELVKKMRETGFTFTLIYGKKDGIIAAEALFFKIGSKWSPKDCTIDREPCRCILRAAYAAHQERSRYEPTDEGEVE